MADMARGGNGRRVWPEVLAAALLLLALAHGCGEPAFAQHVKVGVSAGGGGGGGGAPTDAQYWLSAANGSLSAEVVVSDLATLETAIASYDFSDAANLTNGILPEARIGAFSSLVNINGGFEIADFRCTASAGVLTCLDPTAATGVTRFILQAGAGQSGNIQEWRDSAGGAAETYVDSLRNLAVRSLYDGRGTRDFDLHTSNGLILADSIQVSWTNSTSSTGSRDVGIVRDAAGVVRITDSSTGYGKADMSGLRISGAAANGHALIGNGTDGVYRAITYDDVTGAVPLVGTLPVHYNSSMANDYVAMPTTDALTINGNPTCVTNAGTATVNIYQSDSPFTNVSEALLVGPISCTTTAAGTVPTLATILTGKYIRFVFSSLVTATDVLVTMQAGPTP